MMLLCLNRIIMHVSLSLLKETKSNYTSIVKVLCVDHWVSAVVLQQFTGVLGQDSDRLLFHFPMNDVSSRSLWPLLQFLFSKWGHSSNSWTGQQTPKKDKIIN